MTNSSFFLFQQHASEENSRLFLPFAKTHDPIKLSKAGSWWHLLWQSLLRTYGISHKRITNVLKRLRNIWAKVLLFSFLSNTLIYLVHGANWFNMAQYCFFSPLDITMILFTKNMSYCQKLNTWIKERDKNHNYILCAKHPLECVILFDMFVSFEAPMSKCADHLDIDDTSTNLGGQFLSSFYRRE